MARRTLEVPGIQGNGQIGRMAALLPMGLDILVNDWYDAQAGAVIADITETRLVLNTEPVMIITGGDQDNLNQADRLSAFNADCLRHPWEMIGMKEVKPTYSTTLNTLSEDPTTKNAITSGRHEMVQTIAETWRFFIEADDATIGGPGGIRRWQKLGVNNPVGANGEFALQFQLILSSPEKRWLRRLALTLSAGAFTNGDAFIQRGVNNEEVYRRTKVLNDKILTDYNVRALSAWSGAGAILIDTTETGIPEMIDTMRQASADEIKANTPGLVSFQGIQVLPYSIFNPRFSPSQAGTCTVIAESLGRL